MASAKTADASPPTALSGSKLLSDGWPYTKLVAIGPESATAAEARPFHIRGEVVQGHQRGRELGVRTANLAHAALVAHTRLSKAPDGVYAGFASVSGGPVYKALISLGDAPYFGDDAKALETHLLVPDLPDFYGQQLSVVVAAYIRPQIGKFDSLDDLMKAINLDIELGRTQLDAAPFSELKDVEFLGGKSDLEASSE